MIQSLLHYVAFTLYGGAAVLFALNLRAAGRRFVVTGRALVILGLLAHTAGIGAHCSLTHETPFASVYGTLSMAAWIVALAFVPVEVALRAPAIGVLALPAACALLLTAFMNSGQAPAISPTVRSVMVSVHVLSILVSFALFMLAACCAVFYVWQYRLLKRHGRGGIFRRLPPLDTVDRAAYRLVLAALPLLTAGIVLGAFRAPSRAAQGSWLVDPYTIVSLTAWLVYGAYLYMRTLRGWGGTRLSFLLIAGAALTVLIYFVPSQVHRLTF